MKFQGRECPMATKSFSPLFDMVALFVVSDDSEDVTDRGIIMPDSIKGTWNAPVAVVIACGPACRYVREGDRVLVYVEQGGKIVRHQTDEQTNTVIMAREQTLLGIIGRELPRDGPGDVMDRLNRMENALERLARGKPISFEVREGKL